MKLPQAQISGVQRLAQVSPEQAAQAEFTKGEVAATAINAIGKPLVAAGKIYDNNKAKKAAQEATDEQDAINNAIDPSTGLIDVNSLPDEVRTNYMKNAELGTEIIDGDRLLTQVHNVADGLSDYYKKSEQARVGRMSGNTQRAIYEEREKGSGKKFLQNLQLKGKMSLIEESVNIELKERDKAAAAGDYSGIEQSYNDLKVFVKESKALALKNEAIKQATLVKLDGINDIKQRLTADAFEQLDTSAGLKLIKSEMAEIVKYSGLSKEETDELLYEIENEIILNQEKGNLKNVFDNESPAAANKLVDIAFREEGDNVDQGDEYSKAKLLRTYWDELNRNARTQREAGAARRKADVKNYVNRMSMGSAVDPMARQELWDSLEGLKNQDELRAQMELADKTRAFAVLPASEQREIIKAETKGKPVDAEGLDKTPLVLAQQNTFAKIQEQVAKDAFAQAVKHDLIKPDEAVWDMDDIVGSMINRAGYTDFISQHYGTPASILPASFAKQVAANFRDGDLSPQLLGQLLNGMSYLEDSDALAIGKQITGEGANGLGIGIRMSLEGESMQNILDGKRYLTDDPSLIPKVEGETFEDYLALNNVYDIHQQNSQMRKATIEAIRYEYAGLIGNQKLDEINADVFEQAVNNVTGGAVSYGDSSTQAPYRGITQEQFTDDIAAIDDASIERMGGAYGWDSEQIKMQLDAGTARLESLGRGKYVVFATKISTGRQTAIKQENGSPFILDWNKIYSNYEPATQERPKDIFSGLIINGLN